MLMLKTFQRAAARASPSTRVAFKIAHRPILISSSVSLRQFHLSTIRRNAASESTPEVQQKDEQKLDLSFASLVGAVDHKLVDAFARLGFENMTLVQAKSIRPFVETDKGIVARARTGTGKTLAFGIPLIQDESFGAGSSQKGKVSSIIIAPTRDLAAQIRDELAKVYAALNPKYKSVRKLTEKVQIFVGGESRSYQIKDFLRNTPPIVVATPGRLYDLLQESDVCEKFSDLHFKVLDEADRLLDIGFKEELLRIDSILKDANGGKDFKTVLYSATIDSNVLSFAKKVLGNDFSYVNTVDPNEPETHEKVDQSLVICDDFFKTITASADFVAQNLKQQTEGNDKVFKPIIFMPTIKAVNYYAHMLGHYMREKYGIAQSSKSRRSYQGNSVQVIEFHGKLSQAQRNRAVADFKSNPNSILVTSDVGARGMDFPKVSHVIQLCLPSETSDYIHRIGRTARGSSDKGNAVLFITQAEKPGIRILNQRKIKFAETFEFSDIVSEHDAEEVESVISGLTYTEDIPLARNQKVNNYRLVSGVNESMLGYYKSISNRYNLKFPECAKAAAAFYQGALRRTEKPSISRDFQNKVLGLNDRVADEIFYIRDSNRSFSGRSERSDNFERSDRSGRFASRSFRGKDRDNDSDDQGRSFKGRFSNDRNDRSNRSFDRSDRFEGKRNDRSDRFERSNRNFKGGQRKNDKFDFGDEFKF